LRGCGILPASHRVRQASMKRKIAAIFAADVAGYSKLVAEDEEETLRRLASYRSVMDDFIARAGGRIFNTAGDAVLAEFSSAVEAVRCAIDIQESLRTRNMAYPTSRQMCFRIGITVGDVVERDGDLLGDGVNIAARLEGLAPVGGICISRTVHEQVANKLSVQFADIGEQQVKNIPNPVHAYRIEMRPDDTHELPVKKPAKLASGSAPWVMPVAIAIAGVAVLATAVLVYLTFSRPGGPRLASEPAPPATSVAPAPAVAAAPSPSAAPPSAPPPTPAAPPASRQAEAVVPESIPFIPDRARDAIRNAYLPAADHKALAISTAPIGFSTGQADDATAESSALDMCQRRADALPQPRRCELYAVGDTVVYTHARPPMPPTPWITNDPSIERPLVPGEIPLMRENGKATIAANYLPARAPKALALSPLGTFSFLFGQESADEAVRRALELCGNNAGVPCLLAAVNNDFVVPIPTTMKATGFFQAASAAAIAPEFRDVVASRLHNGGGWSAVAVGAGDRPGLAVNAANEQGAIDGALADCAKQDRSCHVIAIGPFAVESK
jgi:class 3 adenylate cyclase